MVHPSRREVLRDSLKVGGGLALFGVAACGEDEPAATTAAATTAAPTTAAATTAAPTTMGKEAVTITILTADQSAVQFFTDIGPDFAAMHPDYDITFDIPAEQPAEVRQRVLDQLAAGEKIADSTDLDSEDTWNSALAAGLHESGLYDFTDAAQPWVDQIAGGMREGKFKGRYYGIPGLLSAVTYYYRADLFEQAGISADFESWDDFIEGGKKLKAATGANIMIIEDSTSRHFNYMMPHAGGNVFDEEGAVNLDAPENLEALETLVRMVREDIAFTTSEFYGAGTFEAYRDDTIGGAYMPNWYGDLLLPPNLPEHQGKFKMAPPPKFEAGYTSARGGAPIYPVLAGPHQELVFDFLAFGFLSVENNVKRFEDFATPPMNLAAYEDPALADAVHPYLEQPVAPVYTAMIENFATVNTHPLLIRALDHLTTNTVPPVLAGDKEPAAALKEAADAIRAMAGE